MSDSKDVKGFPDLTNKLNVPKKASLFERNKAEQEAKRIREEAENAAALQEFEEQFGGEAQGSSGDYGESRTRGPQSFEPRGPSGPTRRHFIPSALKNSGPGSLGPPSLPRKRALDDPRADRGRERGIFGYNDASPSGPFIKAEAFGDSDEEHKKHSDLKSVERAALKPTLRLSSLPPGMSDTAIRAVLPASMVIDSVRVLPPSGPGSANGTERKSMSAIVAFTQDTPASDLDAAVSSLQNKYLGFGHNLAISRHLSSTALGSGHSISSAHATTTSFPFGAKPIPLRAGPTLSQQPPPGMQRGGFAPPTSYAPADPYGSGIRPPPLQVKVVPPTDIRQLQLIHTTIESVIKHGPEFEALLMSRPEVQREERWAWIWDARSQGGVWYRWRLWQVMTGLEGGKFAAGAPTQHQIFQSGFAWTEPEERLPFEYVTEFPDLISASDYDSSDQDDSEDEENTRRRKRQFDGVGAPPADTNLTPSDEQTYLNPIHKAKLTHLLARLPTTTAKLRKGDVARVTAFAISHAGKGADEVVDMLVTNVLRPYSLSKHANPQSSPEDVDIDMGDAQDKSEQQRDFSASTLIGLYLISDILSASSTSGVRHAWRYRTQFESSFLARNVFAYLGRMEKEQGWGVMRANRWRSSVNNILRIWEGLSVFPKATAERFENQFNNPPVTRAEADATAEAKRRASEVAPVKDSSKSKWKTVDANETLTAPEESVMDMEEENVQPADTRIDENNGDTSIKRKYLNETPSRDAIDGTPMQNETVSQPAQQDSAVAITKDSQSRKRQRPRAEDMFRDDD